jgi:hypothetical protein
MQRVVDPVLGVIGVPTTAEIARIAAASKINTAVYRPIVDLLVKVPVVAFRKTRLVDYVSINLVTLEGKLSKQAEADNVAVVIPEDIHARLIAMRTK